MLQRTPLISMLQPQMLASGLQPDLHLLQKLLWDAAENVVFAGNKVMHRKAEVLLFNAGDLPVRGITQQQDTDGLRWVYAGSGDKVVRWHDTDVEEIFTAPLWQEDATRLEPATFWDILPFGDWVILNNGRGAPQLYKPSEGVEDLGDVPIDVVTMRKKQNMLLAIGYGASKTRVGWSDADDIMTWTATAENMAGSLTLAEFNTPIRASAPLGDAIAIYAEDQLAIMTYIGAPFYFGYKFRLDGIGAVGKMAVASDGKVNVGVGRNGVWWTDSLSYRYLDEGALRDYLQENVNWDQASKIIALQNDVTGCFEFSFPMGDSLVCNEAWSYDPRNGGWSQIPPFSMKAERQLFNKPIIGFEDGTVNLDTASEFGAPLVLRTKPMLAQLQTEIGLTDVHNNVHISEADIFIKAASGVQWRLGSAQEPTGNFTFTPWIDLVPGAVTYKIPRGLPSGVYHVLEMRSIEDSWALDLQGFMLFGNTEGTKRRAAS